MALNRRKARKELVNELEKNYLLQQACNKLGLTRSTVYRWMQENEEFAVALHTAQAVGRRYMSDYVESKLFKNIESREERAIEFWLKHNNTRYRADDDKAIDRKRLQLEKQLSQARAALSAVGRDTLFKKFTDWTKVEKYLKSPEFKRYSQLSKGVYTGNSPHEAEVLEQVRQVITQMKLAEYVQAAENIPEEYTDLVED